MNVWRVVPAINGALMVLLLSVFGLLLVEASDLQAARHLGYPGATVRLVAIPTDQPGAPERLTDAIAAFAADNGISVAYSRSYGSGLVTLLDESERFRNGEGSLAPLVGPAGSGKTALLSAAIGVIQSDAGGLRLPDGVLLKGTFVSDVMFEERYPVLLFSVDAAPFAEGVYLFTGDDRTSSIDSAFSGALADLFDENEMTVVHLMSVDEASIGNFLRAGLSTPYGIMVLMFGGLVALVQLLVVSIYAGLMRDRLFAVAVLGGAKRDLRLDSSLRLLRLVVPGAAAGGVLALLVALATDGLALRGLGARISAVSLALAISIAISAIISWSVAWREARAVGRVVPC